MKQICSLLLCLLAVQCLRAEYLHVKLVDERESLVSGAKFYWKYPQWQDYKAFGENGLGSVETYGQLQRFGNYSQPFNYRVGKSSNPDRTIDLKIVAPGYEVYTWSQTWPASRPEFKTITLQRLELRHHGNSGLRSATSSNSGSHSSGSSNSSSASVESVSLDISRSERTQLNWPNGKVALRVDGSPSAQDFDRNHVYISYLAFDANGDRIGSWNYIKIGDLNGNYERGGYSKNHGSLKVEARLINAKRVNSRHTGTLKLTVSMQ